MEQQTGHTVAGFASGSPEARPSMSRASDLACFRIKASTPGNRGDTQGLSDSRLPPDACWVTQKLSCVDCQTGMLQYSTGFEAESTIRASSFR